MTREEARKAAEVMIAYADGKDIEFKLYEKRDWYRLDYPGFNWCEVDYRIKKEPTYHSLRDAKECDVERDMKEHQKEGVDPTEIETKEMWCCPEGYIFKDEKGNVIDATKIVLEKKKKEYPKTYEECCRIVNANPYVRLVYNLSDGQKYSFDEDNLWLYESIRKLLICRDAYWKIAGEKMGLGKPWKPINNSEICYGIYYWAGEIQHDTTAKWCFLTFPTKKMQDAFYENFKELIESCKELL